jgi:hypothetical protein
MVFRRHGSVLPNPLSQLASSGRTMKEAGSPVAGLRPSFPWMHPMKSLQAPRWVLVVVTLLVSWLTAYAVRPAEPELGELLRQVEQFPAKGKPPQLYQLHGLLADVKPDTYKQPQGEQLWKLAQKLGVSETAYERKPGETLPRPTWQDAGYLHAEQLFPQLRPGFQSTPEMAKTFQEYLAQKVAQPGEVGLDRWEEAKLELTNKASLLYYHTHLFLAEQALAKPLELRGGWSPDPDYWPKYATWVLPYRRKALSTPWSEEISYRVPEVSPQSSGYLLEALRCGAREHNLPITWNLYCDTPGTTPENLRRAYYTAIAHGAKAINFRGAVPKEFAVGPHSIGGPEAVKMWRTVHDLVQETGQFEQIVHPATVRRADVGLLISFAQDLWDPDPDRNHERKCIYLACRFGGYNVEFVTEEEIQAGKWKHLKAIITTGNHLERATARELKKFIRGGGAFSCFGYSGFRDEHNRPMDTLNEVIGVTAVKEKRQGTLGLSKQNLAGLLPIDTIKWRAENAEHKLFAFVLRNSFEIRRGAQVYGRYADGSPMAVRFDSGAGVTWMMGTFLASSFIREGLLPPRPWKPGPGPNDSNNYLPTKFNFDIGDIVTAACDQARYDALFNKLLIEAVVLEGPNGVAVVVINWSPEPREVTLTVQYAPDYVKKAISVAQGELKLKRAFKSVDFKLRVEVADVILLPK